LADAALAGKSGRVPVFTMKEPAKGETMNRKSSQLVFGLEWNFSGED
jgi:hypothetical protein